jgi:hypothetical protein
MTGPRAHARRGGERQHSDHLPEPPAHPAEVRGPRLASARARPARRRQPTGVRGPRRFRVMGLDRPRRPRGRNAGLSAGTRGARGDRGRQARILSPSRSTTATTPRGTRPANSAPAAPSPGPERRQIRQDEIAGPDVVQPLVIRRETGPADLPRRNRVGARKVDDHRPQGLEVGCRRQRESRDSHSRLSWPGSRCVHRMPEEDAGVGSSNGISIGPDS